MDRRQSSGTHKLRALNEKPNPSSKLCKVCSSLRLTRSQSHWSALAFHETAGRCCATCAIRSASAQRASFPKSHRGLHSAAEFPLSYLLILFRELIHIRLRGSVIDLHFLLYSDSLSLFLEVF
jgi:hypothetical protein